MKRNIILVLNAVLFIFPMARAAEEFERKEVDAQGDAFMKKCMEGQMKSMERFSRGYSGYSSGPNGWVAQFYQMMSDRVLHQIPGTVTTTLCMLEAAFGWDGKTVPYSATRTMEMRGMNSGEGGRGRGVALFASDSFTIYSKMSVAEATTEERGELFDAGETVQVVQAWFGPTQSAVTSAKPKVRLVYSGKGTASRGIGVFNHDGTEKGHSDGKFLQTQTVRWDRKADDGVQSVAVQEVMQSTPGQAFQSKDGNSFAPTGGDRNFQSIAIYYPADFTDTKGVLHAAGELELSVNERSSVKDSFISMAATGLMNKVTGAGHLCISHQSGASDDTYSRPSNCFNVTIDTSTGDITSVASEMTAAQAAAKFDDRKVFKSDYNPSPNSMNTMHQGTHYSGTNGAGDTERFKPSDAGGAFAAKKFRD
jgi:hypothetical protein